MRELVFVTPMGSVNLVELLWLMDVAYDYICTYLHTYCCNITYLLYIIYIIVLYILYYYMLL